jgi:hypothetical protein
VMSIRVWHKKESKSRTGTKTADKRCIDALIFERENKWGGKEVVEDVEWAMIEAAQKKSSFTRCTSKKENRILVAIRRLLKQNLICWNLTI